jgi:hypothetical protein
MSSPKYKKAPDAPKRFKSAFIIFSAEKHKEIKGKLKEEGLVEKVCDDSNPAPSVACCEAKGSLCSCCTHLVSYVILLCLLRFPTIQTTDIAKKVSEAWRELNPEEKEVWEKKARKDKARYEVEKAMYKGPWKVPANKRTPKDPSAPKRPMSAFLAFSNKRRAALKRQHPDATNADLSKMLSKTWKEAEPSLRQKYMDEEADLRQTYKVEMAKWRKKVAEEKRAERKEREALAMQAAENRTADALNPKPEGSTDSMPQGFPGGMYGMAGYGVPSQQGHMGDMSAFGGMQQYPNLLGGGFGGMQGGPMQQQLLSQLLAGQQMGGFMPGRPMMYGSQGGAQAGPAGFPSMGGAGGNFGMDGGMSSGQMPQGETSGATGYGGYDGQFQASGFGNMDGNAPASGGDGNFSQSANL